MTNLNTLNTVLVQNIETFEQLIVLDIPGLSPENAFDAWMKANSYWGVVSFEEDIDGEFGYVALVAAEAGPDFVMDMDTGEMEPVENIDPNVELECKLDIAMEIDNADEEFLVGLETENAFKAAAAKPRKARKTKTKSRTKAKGAKMSQPKKIRNFEILVSFIEANPGVSRTDVFCHQDLLQPLRTKAQRRAIAGGDKLEIKRWNRRLNFLIRESGRQGVDIQIERKGRVAHYTINTAQQLELPFDLKAEARNSSIIGNDVSDEVVEKPAVDPMRAEEPENVNLNFEDLLATLDDDAATVKSDDQIAFENAKEMLK